jgi:signal transduction histidine kinase
MHVTEPMSRPRALAVERSLDDRWGIPQPALRLSARNVRRLGTTLVAVAALVAAVAATAASLAGDVEPGASLSEAGDRIAAVSATGFAWRAGIRPGQQIIAITDSTSASGWHLVTEINGHRFSVASATYESALRATLPLGIVAMLAGGLAVVFLRAHRRWVAAAASVGLAAAAPAMSLVGDPLSSTVFMGAAVVAPTLWLAWRPRLTVVVSIAASAAVALLVGAWVLARLGANPAYDGLERLREGVAILGAAGVVAISVALPILRDGPSPITRPRIADALLVAGVAGLALGAAVVASVSPWIIGAVLLATILLLPAWRRWVASRAERTLLADLREHARMEAAEAERAHLARELHDAPLQQLAGVIRRLEVIPAARAESDALRAVAEQLRGVATELRPPILDDLGLAPALEFLAESASTSELPVRAEVDDRTSPDPANRPPADVELAVFRVAQEAVANAVRHARASEIRLSAEVAPDQVALVVVDDGRGLSAAVARAAGRRGRLGLASIRRRAQAIDAEVSISGSEAGTRVAMRWHR